MDLLHPLDPDSGIPLYRQISGNISTAVEDNILKVNDLLPAEREFAKGLSVSRVTVRKAMDYLENKGIVERRRGDGTYIAERIEKSFSKLSSFTEDIAAGGQKPTSKWISKETGPSTPHEAFQLGLEPFELVHRLYRLRLADGEPFAVEHSVIPLRALPEVSAIRRSLYNALETAGNRPVRALQRLRAVAFTGDIAEQLKIAAGSPGLLIERRGFRASGDAVELTLSYYRGDKYDFVAELRLDSDAGDPSEQRS